MTGLQTKGLMDWANTLTGQRNGWRDELDGWIDRVFDHEELNTSQAS